MLTHKVHQEIKIQYQSPIRPRGNSASAYLLPHKCCLNTMPSPNYVGSYYRNPFWKERYYAPCREGGRYSSQIKRSQANNLGNVGQLKKGLPKSTFTTTTPHRSSIIEIKLTFHHHLPQSQLKFLDTPIFLALATMNTWHQHKFQVHQDALSQKADLALLNWQWILFYRICYAKDQKQPSGGRGEGGMSNTFSRHVYLNWIDLVSIKNKSNCKKQEYEPKAYEPLLQKSLPSSTIPKTREMESTDIDKLL